MNVCTYILCVVECVCVCLRVYGGGRGGGAGEASFSVDSCV